MLSLDAVSTLARRRLLAWAVIGGLAVAVCLHGEATDADDNRPADAPAAAGETAQQAKRTGHVIRIRLPITGSTYSTVRHRVLRLLDRAKASGTRPVLIFQFEIAPDGRDFAASSEFGASYQLADFLSSDRLSDATAVAYLPETIEGHAVLVAIACEQLAMGPTAEIGPAGVHEPTISAPLRSAYKEIANRRKSMPAEVALGLLDPARKVLVVETDVSREYVTPEQLEELRKTRTIQSSRTLFDGRQPGRLSADEARQLDLIDFKAASRRDLARALGLRPEALEEAPSLAGPWKAVRVELKGPINAETTRRAQRLIEDAMRRQEVDFVCVWIDSAGGSPLDSVELASFLANLDPEKLCTAAYIGSQALSDAALVAMACDQVVVGPNAVLGGPGEHEPSQEELRLVRESLRKAIAPKKGRGWSLPAAMLDPQLEVYRCTRKGAVQIVEYFSEEELAEQPDRADWAKGAPITQPGRVFKVVGKDAAELGLAQHVAGSFGEFKNLYGLQNDPAMLEPGWADLLIEALASPGMAVVLLAIGFVAVYAELHTPGLGVAGFLAAICFVLFFWSRFLGGTAEWLEVLLFVLGIACLALEVFVLPGFGVFGLGGGALIIVSLVLASQTFVVPRNEYQFAEVQRTLLVLAGAGLGTGALVLLVNRWLPRAPLLGEMVLEPPAGQEAVDIRRRESLAHFENLLGQHGTTTTPLVPSGKARFGDRLVDVIADGEFIPRGAEIVVVEVEGNHVRVRATENYV